MGRRGVKHTTRKGRAVHGSGLAKATATGARRGKRTTRRGSR